MSLVPLVLKFARARRNLRQRLGEGVRTCQCQMHRIFHRYRPEFHYMRGPGPKWHEKHGQANH
jgi:hypothetical protein